MHRQAAREVEIKGTTERYRRLSAGAVVMILLLLLLAGLASPRAEGLVGRETTSLDIRRAVILEELSHALESYRLDRGEYPSTNGVWRSDCERFGGHGYGAEGYIPGLVPKYLRGLPHDPDVRFPNDAAGIAYRSDGVDYKLLLLRTPSRFPDGNPFEDPARPQMAWQVSTFGARHW